MLTVIDEYTHECLAIKTKRRLNSLDVLDCLNQPFLEHGVPEHIRSDNRAEFTAIAVREWWPQPKSEPCSLNREALGKMVTMKALTGN